MLKVNNCLLILLLLFLLQTVCGDLAFVAQSSVSRCLKRVTFLLASLMRDEIKFPSTPEQKAANREGFVEIGRKNNLPGIPGVDGAIDCTHIKLCHTKFDGIQEIYRNRKGYFSLNVQVLYLHLPVQSFKEIVLAVCLKLVMITVFVAGHCRSQYGVLGPRSRVARKRA